MLSIMRKHATSWIIKVFIAIIALVFVFWGVGSIRQRRASRFARVNRDIISIDEVTRTYENLVEQMRRRYKDVMTPELLKKLNLKQEAIDRLIEGRLILQEARRLKLEVTDEEIQARLQSLAVFQTNGRFDPNRYFRVLAANRLTPAEFEQNQRRTMLAEKLGDLVRSFAIVNEGEAFEQFRFQKEKAVIQVVRFDPARYVDKIQVDDKEVEAYYAKHKDRFERPEKAKIGYVLIRPEDLTEKIHISPDEVKDYYNWHEDEFKHEKEIRARHILFKVKPDAKPDEVAAVRKRALKVLAEARKPGADFAALARKYSEGPTSVKGGDLGFFKRGTMVKPFEDAAFSLRPGQVSGLVRTRFGFHIIKVEAVKEAGKDPLDKVKDRIRKKLVLEQAKDLAFDTSDRVLDRALSGESLSKIAASEHLTYKESPYFDATAQAVPGLEAAKNLVSTVFSLDVGEIGPRVKLNDGFAVYKLLDKKPPVVPKLDEIRDEVVKDLKQDKAREQAKEDAEKFLREVSSGKDFQKTAETWGVRVQDSAPFDRQGAIRGFGYQPEINRAVFRLKKAGEVVPHTIRFRDAFLVVRLKSRTDPRKKEFEKVKKDFIRGLETRKRQALFRKWIEDLKNHAEIKIYQQL